MNIKLLLSASLLAACGIANAQTATQITDPARIAEIERHAQQLGAQPMAGSGGDMHHGDKMDRKHMREHRKHMKAMRHHKKMHAKKGPMEPQADNAPPMPMPKN